MIERQTTETTETTTETTETTEEPTPQPRVTEEVVHTVEVTPPSRD